MLYEFIAELDSLSRALILFYLDGNNYLEIAEIVGISETNAATRINGVFRFLQDWAYY